MIENFLEFSQLILLCYFCAFIEIYIIVSKVIYFIDILIFCGMGIRVSRNFGWDILRFTILALRNPDRIQPMDCIGKYLLRKNILIITIAKSSLNYIFCWLNSNFLEPRLFRSYLSPSNCPQSADQMAPNQAARISGFNDGPF